MDHSSVFAAPQAVSDVTLIMSIHYTAAHRWACVSAFVVRMLRYLGCFR